LEEKRAGVPPKSWYRINRAAVKALIHARATTQSGAFRHSRKADNAIPGCPLRPSQNGGKRQFNTKNTSEITPDSTARLPFSPKADSTSDDAAVDQQLVETLIRHQVNRVDAVRLARDFPEECWRQLEYLKHLPPRTNLGGWLRSAILNGNSAPAGWDEAKRKVAQQERHEQHLAVERTREAYRAMHLTAYRKYLAASEAELASMLHKVHSDFVASEKERRLRLERSPVSEVMREKILREFHLPEARLDRLEEFLAGRNDHPVLSFWKWDAARSNYLRSTNKEVCDSNSNRNQQPQGGRWQDNNGAEPRHSSGDGRTASPGSRLGPTSALHNGGSTGWK
jgi:hypothetical protein